MTNNVWINRNQLEMMIKGTGNVNLYAYKPGQVRTDIRLITDEKTGEIKEIFRAGPGKETRNK